METTTASAEELFGLLWDTMADLLGTAATAALLRRALRLGASKTTALKEVEIVRDDLTYGYKLPPDWRQPNNSAAIGDLRALCGALRPLLVDLTGPVVARRLDGLGPLRAHCIAFHAEGARA